jgi:hypothetical protein
MTQKTCNCKVRHTTKEFVENRCQVCEKPIITEKHTTMKTFIRVAGAGLEAGIRTKSSLEAIIKSITESKTGFIPVVQCEHYSYFADGHQWVYEDTFFWVNISNIVFMQEYKDDKNENEN